MGTHAIRTLLVDDDARLRTLLRCILEDTGRYDIVGEAGDGADAVTLAESLMPDLVLLDLAMPVMDGYEALPRIKKASPASIVVAVSMMEAAEAGTRVVDLGAAAFLDKGMGTQQMVAALDRLTATANAGGA